MSAQYEIWDNANGNMVYAYETQEEALADVRTMIEVHGAGSVSAWVLQFDDYDAPPRNIAIGDALVCLANGAVSSRAIAD